jgi:hypothetical protein
MSQHISYLSYATSYHTAYISTSPHNIIHHSSHPTTDITQHTTPPHHTSPYSTPHIIHHSIPHHTPSHIIHNTAPLPLLWRESLLPSARTRSLSEPFTLVTRPPLKHIAIDLIYTFILTCVVLVV